MQTKFSLILVSVLFFTAMLFDPVSASKPTVPWTMSVSAKETAKNEVTVSAVLHSQIAVENMSFNISPSQGELLRGISSWQGSMGDGDEIKLEAVFSNENMQSGQWVVFSNGQVESVKMGKQTEVYLNNNRLFRKAKDNNKMNIKAGAEEYPMFR